MPPCSLIPELLRDEDVGIHAEALRSNGVPRAEHKIGAGVDDVGSQVLWGIFLHKRGHITSDPFVRGTSAAVRTGSSSAVLGPPAVRGAPDIET